MPENLSGVNLLHSEIGILSTRRSRLAEGSARSPAPSRAPLHRAHRTCGASPPSICRECGDRTDFCNSARPSRGSTPKQKGREEENEKPSFPGPKLILYSWHDSSTQSRRYPESAEQDTRSSAPDQ